MPEKEPVTKVEKLTTKVETSAPKSRESTVAEVLPVYHNEKATSEELGNALKAITKQDIGYKSSKSFLRNQSCPEEVRKAIKERLENKFAKAGIVYPEGKSPFNWPSVDEMREKNMIFSKEIPGEKGAMYKPTIDLIAIPEAIRKSIYNFPMLPEFGLVAGKEHEETHRVFWHLLRESLPNIATQNKNKYAGTAKMPVPLDVQVRNLHNTLDLTPLFWINEMAAYMKNMPYCFQYDLPHWIDRFQYPSVYGGTPPQEKWALSLLMPIAAAENIGIPSEVLFTKVVEWYKPLHRIDAGSGIIMVALAWQLNRYVASELKKAGVQEDVSEIGKRYILRSQLKAQITQALVAEELEQVYDQLPHPSFELNYARDRNFKQAIYFPSGVLEDKKVGNEHYKPALILSAPDKNADKDKPWKGTFHVDFVYFNPATGKQLPGIMVDTNEFPMKKRQEIVSEFVAQLPPQVVRQLLITTTATGTLFGPDRNGLSDYFADQIIRELGNRNMIGTDEVARIIARRWQNFLQHGYEQSKREVSESIIDAETKRVWGEIIVHPQNIIGRYGDNVLCVGVSMQQYHVDKLPYGTIAVISIPLEGNRKMAKSSGHDDAVYARVGIEFNDGRDTLKTFTPKVAQDIARTLRIALPLRVKDEIALAFAEGRYEQTTSPGVASAMVLTELKKQLKDEGFIVEQNGYESRMLQIERRVYWLIDNADRVIRNLRSKSRS